MTLARRDGSQGLGVGDSTDRGSRPRQPAKVKLYFGSSAEIREPLLVLQLYIACLEDMQGAPSIMCSDRDLVHSARRVARQRQWIVTDLDRGMATYLLYGPP